MKKLAILFSLLLMSGICFAQALPDDWIGDTDIDTYQEDTIVHSGTYSCKVVVNSGTQGNCDFSNDVAIPVTAGDTYTVSFWAYTSEHTRITCALDWTGASSTYPGTYIGPDTGGWAQYTQSDVVPDGVTAVNLRLRFYDTSGFTAPETCYVDDVTFESPTGTSLPVTNGDFESWPSSSSIIKAYAIGTEDMDVFYAGAMTSVSVSDYQLTGTSTITFTAAEIDATDPTLVHLTDASESMIGDLTLDTITDAANSTSYEFYAGVTPIALTNTLWPSDGHIENGILATFDATVTANDGYNNVWFSDFDGAYNGVLLFDYNFVDDVAVDDQVLFVAERDEYNNVTELKNPVIIDSYGGFPITPTVIPGSDIDMTIPANTNPAEQWEGQLVVIENVIVAANTKDDLYIGSDDGWTTTFVIGDNVDYQYGSSGTALDAAVASGNPVDLIGVVDWQYTDGYFRVNPRDADDITPSGGNPSVIKAWALSEDELDVMYDIDMTSATPGWYYLTGTATITFDTVEIDGDEPQIVHLSGASQDMIGDLVLDNIYDSNSDTDYDFYAGITPIALTNTNNPSKGHIQNDRVATFFATVSANDAFSDVWVSDDTGAYNGVHVFDYDFVDLVSVSDDVLFYATRDEYNNKTELVDPVLLNSETGEDVVPTVVTGLNIDWTIPANTDPAEMWEGQLIMIENAIIQGIDGDEYVGSDDSWNTTFVIGDAVDYHYTAIGTLLDSAVASGEPYDIIGVVDWNYSEEHYRINPRGTQDIIPNVSVDPVPGTDFVLQNHPNPFAGSTTISFSLPQNHSAEIKIYNIHGQLVKTLSGVEETVFWNGKDEKNNDVASGIYFYTLDTKDTTISKKMILMR
ncbi:MAG TPA: T9SS type A sorting domain-containing protein [Candidatus Cloacimonetes bacterium]|nr:T9SS type A sorting domain-containing protein [Candidatus Cloacimonadota bacterium]HEX38328.1 T9SS type A sorting domain-containing protein [Candidatus Cloacimonadota bacterium]